MPYCDSHIQSLLLLSFSFWRSHALMSGSWIATTTPGWRQQIDALCAKQQTCSGNSCRIQSCMTVTVKAFLYVKRRLQLVRALEKARMPRMGIYHKTKLTNGFSGAAYDFAEDWILISIIVDFQQTGNVFQLVLCTTWAHMFLCHRSYEELTTVVLTPAQ